MVELERPKLNLNLRTEHEELGTKLKAKGKPRLKRRASLVLAAARGPHTSRGK